MLKKLKDAVRKVTLQDILTARYHSRDFTSSRAEYISVRVRTLALLFAVLAPLWIPIDAYVLEGNTFWTLVAMRVTFSVLLLALALWGTRCTAIRAARARAVAFVLVTGSFYLASRVLFGDHLPESGILAGYAFLPFLMVALLSVLPLTLVEGLSLVVLSSAFFIAAEQWLGTLLSVATLGDIWLLALLAMIALWVQMTQLHMLMRLYREATRDALTGLVNRRILFGWLDKEILRARHHGKPLSVILFDLDLFKRINDSFGHLAGDAVLYAFGQLLKRELAMTELVGRYGGEEFLAILPGVDAERAAEVAERVRAICSKLGVQHPDGRGTIRFTTSCGVASLKPGEGGQVLLSRVDQSLYLAKASGRDFVAVAE